MARACHRHPFTIPWKRPSPPCIGQPLVNGFFGFRGTANMLPIITAKGVLSCFANGHHLCQLHSVSHAHCLQLLRRHSIRSSCLPVGPPAMGSVGSFAHSVADDAARFRLRGSSSLGKLALRWAFVTLSGLPPKSSQKRYPHVQLQPSPVRSEGHHAAIVSLYSFAATAFSSLCASTTMTPCHAGKTHCTM